MTCRGRVRVRNKKVSLFDRRGTTFSSPIVKKIQASIYRRWFLICLLVILILILFIKFAFYRHLQCRFHSSLLHDPYEVKDMRMKTPLGLGTEPAHAIVV